MLPIFTYFLENYFWKEDLHRFYMSEHVTVHIALLPIHVRCWAHHVDSETESRSDCWIIFVFAPAFREPLCFHPLALAQGILNICCSIW